MRVLMWLGLCLSLAACSSGTQTQTSYVFGTMVQVTVAGGDADRSQRVVDDMLRDLDRLHRELHAWQPGPLQQVNQHLARGEPAPVTPDITELLTLSQDAWRRSDGLFNAAIGGLIASWGFHSDLAQPRLPEATVVQGWLDAAPTPLDVQVQGGVARSRNRAVQLDFGGIAKGWALDRCARHLRAAGIHNALINIGGNVMALGRNGDRPWHVALRDPVQPQNVMLDLDLQDGEAVGTSGDYQRFFIVDGIRYSHLLDPRTGQPARHLRSVTVLTAPGPQAGLLSDVASKPLFIGGLASIGHHASRFGVPNWLAVGPDRTVYLNRSMRARVEFHKPVPKVVVLGP